MRLTDRQFQVVRVVFWVLIALGLLVSLMLIAIGAVIYVRSKP